MSETQLSPPFPPPPEEPVEHDAPHPSTVEPEPGETWPWDE